jgi:SAM-dependent methyltransferase
MPRDDWQQNTIEAIFRPRGLYPEGRIVSVLDVGCGLALKSQFIAADIRVGVDIWRPYLEKIDAPVPYVTVNADAMRIDELFLPRSFDLVLVLDLIEHLEKPQALELIRKAEAIARRAVVLETPKGFLAQDIDILGMGGDHFQTHRCGFESEELAALGYSVIERDYRLSPVRRHSSQTAPATVTLLNAIKQVEPC